MYKLKLQQPKENISNTQEIRSTTRKESLHKKKQQIAQEIKTETATQAQEKNTREQQHKKTTTQEII